MLFSTDTLKMAVIGDPIDHSLSPFLHSCIIEELGMDAAYFPFRVTGEETGTFYDAAKYLGFCGFNATMPHKLNLLELVDEIDADAAMYGAINTVRIRDGIAKGYNTDVQGLLMALEGRGRSVKGAKIMMIGAGGVAGALVRGFADAGAASVVVLNRTLSKAEAITDIVPANDIADRYETALSALALSDENLRAAAAEADIIVNCTPLGMSGVNGNFSDFSFLEGSHAFVSDLIYNPWETALLAYASSIGLETMNGLDMLIYQGLIAFEIFTDVKLDMKAEFEKIYPRCAERLAKQQI